MIQSVNEVPDRAGLWSRIAAPLDPSAIQWRQDGKPLARDGKWFARFVAFIDAQFVRERLDAVVPGEWDLTIELLPTMSGVGLQHGEVPDEPYAFKARLQILGVIREDVGHGKDYKTAATDAFKRAAVRFGIAHELYAYEQNWVQVDSDSKYAKPVEDPNAAYARRYGTVTGEARSQSQTASASATPPVAAPRPTEGEQRRPPQASAGASASTATRSPASNAARSGSSGPVMPFGKTKGTPLANLSDDEIKGARDWAASKDKTDWAQLLTTELNRRVETALDMAPVPDDQFPPALEDHGDDLPFN